MQLNVPSDRLIVPVMMYDPAMPPALPPVDVPAMVQGIVQNVAVELINHIGMRASASPARMVMYNQMVMNGFMNEEFRSLLQLSCQYLVLKYTKGYIRTPHEGIQEAVSEICTLWVSNLVMIYPELKSLCSPQIVNVAMQNVPVYANLKQEIQSMMNNQMPNNPQGWGHQQPQQQQTWGYQNTPPHQQPVPQQGYPQGYPQQLPAGQWVTNQYGQQMFVPMQQAAMQPVQQGWVNPQHQGIYQPNQGWGGQQPGNFQYQRPVSGHPNQQGYPPANVVEASIQAKDAGLQSRFMGQLARKSEPEPQQQQTHPTPTMTPPPTPQQVTHFVPAPPPAPAPPETGYRKVHQLTPEWTQQETTPVDAPTKQPETTETKELIIKGGSEMDRSAHSVVYFGETVTEGIKERQQDYQTSVDKLSEASSRTMELPEGVEDTSDNTHYIYPVVCYDDTLENLEICSKIKYLNSRDGDKPSPVFRVFGKAATPFIGRPVLKTLSSNLMSVNSLSKLAERMKVKMKEALTSKGGLRSVDDVDTIAYLNYLDRELTNRVNDILQNNLQANVKIDSFTTDVPGMSEWLMSKRGSKYSYGWDYCSNELFKRLVDGFDSEIDNLVQNNYDLDEKVTGVPTTLACSFTFTELTLVELGFEFKEKLVKINKDKAPALYKIAASLSKHKKEMEMDTDVDYLVTSDGAKYRIYKNHVETNSSYWITQV